MKNTLWAVAGFGIGLAVGLFVFEKTNDLIYAVLAAMITSRLVTILETRLNK